MAAPREFGFSICRQGMPSDILVKLETSWAHVAHEGGALILAQVVQFDYGSTDLSRLFSLEERLEAAIAAAGVGEFDGNEIATDGSDGTLYMYGPDADALFAAVRPALEATDFMRGARVRLRYGPPEDGIREVEVVLGT